MVQYRDLNNLMEIRNHSKSKASLKNLTSIGVFKFLFLSLLILYGCNEKEEPFYINLDTDTLIFGYESGNETITVSNNGDWSVSGEMDWCKVLPKTGNGNLTITVTVSENGLLKEREVILTFRCRTEISTIKVTQQKAEEWVLINDVRWATRNIGTPHTFAQTPEDYGDYYQWNNGTTNLLVDTEYYSIYYIDAISWLPTNDPSPSGYRLPTLTEIENLFDATYVTNEWITRNDVNGRRFTDKTSGKSIFLPAAGFCDNLEGKLKLVGTVGNYYGGTRGEYGVHGFLFGDDLGADLVNWGSPSIGFPVRPVAE